MDYLKNKTVVVPYDFSDFAKNAVDVALEMADESTSLHLIHSVEPVASIVAYDIGVPIAPDVDMEIRRHAIERLQELFGSEKYKRFEQHCVFGDPGSQIVKLAKSLRANLIVMPSHGRSGLSRLLIGSVAERVTRLANCPVLILRAVDNK